MRLEKVLNEEDSFFVVEDPSTATYREKGSKFIAKLYPLNDLKEAETIRKSLKKEYYDATHISFGLRIGFSQNLVEKCSDGGEPPHTAGDPILNALREKRLTNCAIFVIRYFGGTKLGTSGLIKSYNKSALLAIENAKIREGFETLKCEIEIPYSLYNQIHYAIKKSKGTIQNEEKKQSFVFARVEVAKKNKEILDNFLKEIEIKWKNQIRWKWK